MHRTERLQLTALLPLVLLTACMRQPVRPAPPASTPPDLQNLPDAVPKAEPRSKSGNPAFYEVMGKRYAVLPTASGYAERGVASWYGPTFHGGRTSSGEKYDMYAMTAAHKTLPLPCYVKVTNLKNGRSVVVRVNDRGPFVDNRVIDLSHSAAARLDMIREGTAMVEVRVIEPEGSAPTAATPAPTPAAPTTALYIQAGAFGEQTNADRLVQRLQAEGMTNAFMRKETVNGRTIHRVRVGPVPSVPEFDKLIARLRALGIEDARLAFD